MGQSSVGLSWLASHAPLPPRPPANASRPGRHPHCLPPQTPHPLLTPHTHVAPYPTAALTLFVGEAQLGEGLEAVAPPPAAVLLDHIQHPAHAIGAGKGRGRRRAGGMEGTRASGFSAPFVGATDNVHPPTPGTTTLRAPHSSLPPHPRQPDAPDAAAAPPPPVHAELAAAGRHALLHLAVEELSHTPDVVCEVGVARVRGKGRKHLLRRQWRRQRYETRVSVCVGRKAEQGGSERGALAGARAGARAAQPGSPADPPAPSSRNTGVSSRMRPRTQPATLTPTPAHPAPPVCAAACRRARGSGAGRW